MTSADFSVVLVDDADDVRTLVKVFLGRSLRFEVVGEGGNGAEAIELVRRHRPDVVLLDVSMPVMDGLEALPAIRELSPATRVVMFTGFAEQGLTERAVALGAAGLLTKSASIDRLAGDLLAVLAAGSGDEPAARGVTEPAGAGPAGAGPAGAGPAGADRAGADTEPIVVADAIAAGDTELLGEHLERFRDVFDEAAIGMGTMTLTGRLVRANRALAQLVGRPLAELVGMPYHLLTEDLAAAQLAAALAEHERTGHLVHLEHVVRVGGDARRLDATIAAARDSLDRPLYLFLQVQDITEQRAAEEALRSSEERFGLLVDSVEDYAIFMLDPQGHVASWNSGAQRTKGYTAQEIIGQHFRVFYPPAQRRSGHPEHELEIAASAGRYEEEGWRLRKDGTMFWASVVISAVHDSRGRLVGFAKVTRDITERRRLLVEQERARAELADANRALFEANERLASNVAEQSQFLSVTVHELRNPISVVTGAATMLVRHGDALTGAERAALLESMTGSAARLNRLLGDLLTASRLESGGMELHDQPVAVAALLDALRPGTAGSLPGAELQVSCAGELYVRGDRDRLAQALENLVLNGLAHGAGPVTVHAQAHDGIVEIRVSDSGPGVPAAVLPRLFERFATGRTPGGTGLGLFIVRELARAHGGDVHYEAGERPTFVLSLPQEVPAG